MHERSGLPDPSCPETTIETSAKQSLQEIDSSCSSTPRSELCRLSTTPAERLCVHVCVCVCVYAHYTGPNSRHSTNIRSS